MKKLNLTKISIFLVLVAFLSCRKEADFVQPSANRNTIEGNFEAFWNAIDQNYVFFNYDPVDWDALYKRYRPQVTNTTSKKELFRICSEMMSVLVDGHRLLDATNDNLGTYTTFNKDFVEKHPFLDPEANLVSYLDTSVFYTLDGYKEGVLGTELVFSRMKKSNGIFYFKLRFFGDALQNAQNSAILDQIFKEIQNAGYYGVIFDLRGNGGGRADEFNVLFSRLVKTEFVWGYSQVRTQRDRFTMSGLISEKIKPNGTYLNLPIVLLTDRYSFSAAEIMALATKKLPNVVHVGDTTGGATGPISDFKEYTGNVTMPNGWKIELAQRVTLDADKKIYEGTGVPPKHVVKISQTDFSRGIDKQLEFAIDLLKP